MIELGPFALALVSKFTLIYLYADQTEKDIERVDAEAEEAKRNVSTLQKELDKLLVQVTDKEVSAVTSAH